MNSIVKKIICHPVFIGSVFFLVQLLFILHICPEPTIHQAWIRLAGHWDSLWYETITQFGYRVLTDANGEVILGLNQWGWPSSFQAPSNVVFFPGYPYLARLLTVVFTVSPRTALLLVAQGSTLLFWCLLFYILRGMEWRKQLYAGALIATFPTSWFLFMGYSEGLFILFTCLMLWLATQKRYNLSGLSGMVMTSTRLIGVPVVAAPLLAKMVSASVRARFASGTVASTEDPSSQAPRDDGRVVTYTPYFKVAMIGLLGCIGFLIYCEIQFGSWHLYFDLSNRGWQAGATDPWFLFRHSLWFPTFSFAKILLSSFFWLLVISAILMCRKQYQLDQSSLTWYIAAVLLLVFTCYAIAPRDYNGIVRYLYPIWVLFVISDAIHPQEGLFFRMKNGTFYKILVPIMMLISIRYGVTLLTAFFSNSWVA